MQADIIYKYFPNLDQTQRRQIDALGDLYTEWNEKINVISRKDINNLYEHHVLHSLAIARFLGELSPGTSFIDIGTGGGFPGIPLAVFYPQCTFHLIDRIGKKIRVASEIASAIGLTNVTMQHGDINECKLKVNYVVSRAVMPLNDLVKLIRKNIAPDKHAKSTNIYPNGLVCLKGSDIATESTGLKSPILNIPVGDLIAEPHFESKSVIYMPLP